MNDRTSKKLPKGFVDPSIQEPTDLQICECWDDDLECRVFAQWLAGSRRFFDVELNYVPEITRWRPQV